MDDDELYFFAGGCLGVIPAIAAFFGSWWYCIVTYGYLLGFGLGWLPSIILAVIIFNAIKLLWGPAALLALFLIVYDRKFSPKRSSESQAVVSPPLEIRHPTADQLVPVVPIEVSPPLEIRHPTAWIGSYAGSFGGGASGKVDIAPTSKGRFKVSISVSSPSCTGEMSGVVKGFGTNPIKVSEWDNFYGRSCSVKLYHRGDHLIVTENLCSGLHGFKCSFDGQVRSLTTSTANDAASVAAMDAVNEAVAAANE